MAHARKEIFPGISPNASIFILAILALTLAITISMIQFGGLSTGEVNAAAPTPTCSPSGC